MKVVINAAKNTYFGQKLSVKDVNLIIEVSVNHVYSVFTLM